MNTTAAAESVNPYHAKANAFLEKHGIKFRATLSNTKAAPWEGEHETPGFYRNHYRVTLSKHYKTKGIYPARLVFDFWGSQNDARANRHPVAYDVLACISGEAHCAATFKEFCSEFGYDEDSRSAYSTFKRCSTFARRLRAFFTEEELKGLAEIQ